MLTILRRYIAKTILTSTGLVTLIIMAVSFVVILLGELKDIGEGDYSIPQAFVYVLTRLPNDIYLFSPMLVLIGSIVGLSILSSYRELAVMRASGFSIRDIMTSTFSAALVMIVAITLVGETVAPNLNHKAEIYKENAQHAGQTVVTASGAWFHVENNFIHVHRALGRRLLEGVTLYEFDAAHHLKVAYYAETMTLRDKQWVMNNVVMTQFFDDRTRSRAFTQVPWEIGFNANLLNVGQINPAEMTLPALLTFSNYLEKNGLQASEYRYSFWQRLFQPIASLIIVFLALPFVLSVMSTTAMGWRIVVGVLAGFGFYISNALLGQLCIVYQIPTMLAALLPLILFALCGVFISRRLIKQ